MNFLPKRVGLDGIGVIFLGKNPHIGREQLMDPIRLQRGVLVSRALTRELGVRAPTPGLDTALVANRSRMNGCGDSSSDLLLCARLAPSDSDQHKYGADSSI